MFVDHSLLLFAIVSFSFSNAAKPPNVPPKEGEVGDFFWRPATREVVKLMAALESVIERGLDTYAYLVKPLKSSFVKLEFEKNSMNESADPCDDFYKFSCGNFGKKSNYVPDGEIRAKVDKEIDNIIFNKMPTITNSKVINSTNIIMQSCLKHEKTQSMSEVFEILTEEFSNFTLKELFIYMADYDIQTSFKISLDVYSHSDVRIGFGATDDDFSLIYYPSYKKIKEIIKDTKLASKVFDYTFKLIYISQDSSNNIEKNNIDNQEWIEPFWVDIQTILDNMDENQVIENETFIDYEYFEKLDKLINKTEGEVVRAHAIMKMTYYLGFATSDGLTYEGTRKESCRHFLMDNFHVVLLSLISQELLPKEVKDGVREVFDNVLESIVETLERQEWLGSSRYNAIKKAREGDQWIGLPDKFSNYTDLDSVFEAIDVDENADFLEHLENVLHFKQREKVGLLRKTRTDIMTYIDAKSDFLTINAYNWRADDLTVYTMGILQAPFFHFRFPAFLNYGILGMTFAHEYGHGLAEQRSPGPYFMPDDTISQETMDEFARRADCLVDQFDHETLVTEEGIAHKLNGTQYLDENIADLAGFEVTFKAYKKVMNAKRHPKLLKELDGYTNDQLFFVSTAQFFCHEVTEEYWSWNINNEHAPPPNRVNAVRNSDDFAKAFECPVGSKMNPQKKCRLWD